MKIVKLLKNYTTFASTMLLFACLFAPAANAVIFENLKPLSEIKLMPEEEFLERTKLIEEVPYDDAFLDYSIQLPKDFQLSTAKLSVTNLATNVSQRVLGVVSRYVGAPVDSVRSSFVLEALELTHEISARNWFINYVIENGLSMDQVGTGSDKSIEAVYIEIIDDVTYIVRIKAVKNGPRMIMARYYLPKLLYEQEHVVQAQVIDSFKLRNTEKTTVEGLKKYGFLDQSFIRYLESWTLDAPYIRTVDRMEARVFRNVKGDRLDGQINVFVSKKHDEKTRSSEIEYYKKMLILKGYQLADFIEKRDFEYAEEMKLGLTEVYQLKSVRQNYFDYEAWFSFLENKDYYYFVIMYTPERQVSFESWARNVEAYRIMLKNIERENKDPNFMKIQR